MARYSLGFDDEETRELEFIGRRLAPVVDQVLSGQQEVFLDPWLVPHGVLRRQAVEFRSVRFALWAESDNAALLLTSEIERRRFQAWEREALLTAGMPRRWSNATARQSAEAWEFMGQVMTPEELPRFVRQLVSEENQREDPRFLRVYQWWGRLREAVTGSGSEDGQRTLGGFVSGLCNMAVRPTQYDESAASSMASVIIAAPTCVRALRDFGRRRRNRVDNDDLRVRQQALDGWAACLSAVVTTWPDAM